MAPLTKISFLLTFLTFGQSLGQDESDFKKIFKEFDINRESLRKSHVKTYSMHVGYYYCLLFKVCELHTFFKYPPVWSIVKNPNNASLIEYIGSGVDAVNYFAKHFDLM